MFIPHTDAERQEMLERINKTSIESLFEDVPEKYRFPTLNLPDAISEMDALSQIKELANANGSTEELSCFLGAGAYDHYIPAVVDSILSRGDFFTAYTPYQPEISQGTLQAIFEFQTLMARLTGMDAANASHYDGATAAAEACISAYHHFKGKRTIFLTSQAVNPQYREVISTYCRYLPNFRLVEHTDNPIHFMPEKLFDLIDENTAAVIVQYPDFFGNIYMLKALSEKIHAAGGLLIVVTNPISLGILIPPGDMGADIVVGEGQPLGLPLSFGGPYLGFFTVKHDLIRRMSGRLVGETVDSNSIKGYVLTLTAREQHIRREKATSNICSNQGLMALAATVYLSALGKNGLHSVADLCFQKAHYTAEMISGIHGFEIVNSHPFFHEFVVKCPKSIQDINKYLLDHDIIGGFDLSQTFPELQNHMLIAITEKIRKHEIDFLCEVLKEISNA